MLKNVLSIFILRPLLVLTLFILSACSGLKSSEFSRQSPGPDGEYLGWHCEGEVALRDNWNCSEKLLKDGLVVVEPAAQFATVLAGETDSGRGSCQAAHDGALGEALGIDAEIEAKVSQSAAEIADRFGRLEPAVL